MANYTKRVRVESPIYPSQMKITDFADPEKVSDFDQMWKRPSRPHIICDGYMLLLARPSGLAIYCSLEMHIFRKFEVRAVYTHRK